MMTDPFDREFAWLARRVPPQALSDLEQRVATAIAGAPPAGGGPAVARMAVAGLTALLLGVAGAGAVAGRIAAREQPVAVAALDSALAPSTLLLGR